VDLGSFLYTRRVMRSLVVPYVVGVSPTALAMLWLVRDHVEDGLVAWSLAGLLAGGATAAQVAAMSWRVDREVTLDPTGAPLARSATALGLVGLAHWAPFCLLLPVAALRLGFRGGSVDDVALAVLPWLAAGAAGLLVLWGDQRARRQRSGARPSALVDVATSIPAPWLLSGLYGTSAVLPSLAWFSWAIEYGWERNVGWMALGTWALLGFGGAALFAGGYGPLQQRLDGARLAGARQLQLAGLVVVAHWLTWFALALVGELFRDPDARFTVLWSAFAAVVVGTMTASVGSAFASVDRAPAAS
jgi:hypothetical protein